MATTTMTSAGKDLPNGPAAAALLAGGLGSLVMGLATFLVETNSKGPLGKMLTWAKPVGPLSGKSDLAILVFFVSWAVLHFAWKDKETNFSQIAMISIALLIVGLILTFPPFWTLFAG